MNRTTDQEKLLVTVLAFLISAGSAEADFTCGHPVNLGPNVNSSSLDAHPSISADGLSILFYSTRSGGRGGRDIWMATRETTDGEWNAAVNLGSPVNGPYRDSGPSISADGLTLFFDSDRPGGSGGPDVWMTTRATPSAPWTEPVNLGPTVNSSSEEAYINISTDGLELYFQSNRPGGHGGYDIWVTTRMTKDDPWGTPVNLGPPINSSSGEGTASISPDGLALFFASDRPGGYAWWDILVATRPTASSPWGEPMNLGPVVNGTDAATAEADAYDLYFISGRPGGSGGLADLWQVSFDPVVDLDGDGTVALEDVYLMLANWGTDSRVCDVGPTPFGDGIVDADDLKVLASYLGPSPVAHWPLDEAEGTVARDSVSGNEDVVMGGALWQPTGGKVGGALELDGVDDCIIAGFGLNTADPEMSSGFSIFAWIKGGAPGQTIISEPLGADLLAADAEGKLMTELASAGGSPLLSDAIITDGQWHRVGLVWHGSQRILYVDGVVVAEDRQDGLEASASGLYIGVGNNYAPGSFFSGLIDDVCIYNRVVSP